MFSQEVTTFFTAMPTSMLRKAIANGEKDIADTAADVPLLSTKQEALAALKDILAGKSDDDAGLEVTVTPTLDAIDSVKDLQKRLTDVMPRGLMDQIKALPDDRLVVAVLDGFKDVAGTDMGDRNYIPKVAILNVLVGEMGNRMQQDAA